MNPGTGLLECEQQQAERQAHGQEEADPLPQALALCDQVVERPEAGRTA
jgi:multisubunit Na+/H+ antiporter MnhC subunit